MSDRPQKQALAKADLLTFGSGVMTKLIVSLLMELSIGDETHSLTLCEHGKFWQSWSHLEKVVAMQPYKFCYYCELPNTDTCPAGGISL